MAKTQRVATGTVHKPKLDESAESSHSGQRHNDRCVFEIGLKRTIGPRGKPFSVKGHTTMHHNTLLMFIFSHDTINSINSTWNKPWWLDFSCQ
jgi:hypothetical protein